MTRDDWGYYATIGGAALAALALLIGGRSPVALARDGWRWLRRRSPEQGALATASDLRSTLPARDPDYVTRASTIESGLFKLTRAPGLIIHGPRGCGKTALTRELAHRLIEEPSVLFPTHLPLRRACWVTCRNHSPTTQQVLDEVARQCGFDAVARLPPAERLGVLKHLLSERSTLIVIDNFETVADPAETLQQLGELPAAAKLILNTSVLPATAHRFQIETLGPMIIDETCHMIQGRSNQDIELSLPDMELLHETTGGLPLAIEWSLGQVAAGSSIGEVADLLMTGQADVCAELFTASWAALNRAARELLLGLAFLPVGLHVEVATRVGSRASIAELTRSRLIEQRSSISVVELHPLAQAYVRERASPPSGTFPLHIGLRLVEGLTDLLRRRAEGGVEEDVHSVFDQLPNVTYLCSQTDPALARSLAYLVEAAEESLLTAGMFLERATLGERFASLLTNPRDTPTRVRLLVTSGQAFDLVGEAERGRALLEAAMSDAKSYQLPSQVVRSKRALLASRYRTGTTTGMLAEVDELLVEARVCDDEFALVDVLYLAGNIAFYLGESDLCISRCEEMLAVTTSLNIYARADAYALEQRALALGGKGRMRHASDDIRRGLDIACEYEDMRQEARLLLARAKVNLARHRRRSAVADASSSLRTFSELGLANEREEATAVLHAAETKARRASNGSTNQMIFVPTAPCGGD